MSVFDPEAFLNATTDTEGSTYITPVPPGEYRAQVDKIEFREGKSKKDDSVFYSCDITWAILDDAVKQQIGRDPKVRQQMFVDIDANGQLDFSEGKNVRLNRVRAAVGQNVAGRPWSPAMLKGNVAMITVTQRQDPNDEKNFFNDVKNVGAV